MRIRCRKIPRRHAIIGSNTVQIEEHFGTHKVTNGLIHSFRKLLQKCSDDDCEYGEFTYIMRIVGYLEYAYHLACGHSGSNSDKIMLHMVSWLQISLNSQSLLFPKSVVLL